MERSTALRGEDSIMFLDELTPVFREFVQEPVAFFGGLCSGLLRLNLSEDPVKSWLDTQSHPNRYPDPMSGSGNGRSSGPQSISID